MSATIEEARRRVLLALESMGCSMSGLGFAAYPGAKFKSPQGAALAVAPLVERMKKEGLVYRHSFFNERGFRGYEIRLTGRGRGQL